MIPLGDAQRRVLESLVRLPMTRASLWSSAGLVLADDVAAPHDVPPFANSAMDGYAVRHDDLGDPMPSLRVVEDLAAGHVAGASVEAGTAIKIMTGAPLPAGADTIIPVEDASQEGDVVSFTAVPQQGASVRAAGGDVAAGQIVFSEGTRLTPAHLGVLAAVGVSTPRVYRRPRVAVLSTGDEVQPPETKVLEPGWIRDANRPLLVGMLGELGVDVQDYGIVPDNGDMLRNALHRAARECDAILTSGGVSMGEYDLVKQVLTELGGVDLWKVAMKPAKPFAFGAIDGTPLFGLPGNPVSVMVAFEQFVRPSLLTMMGSLYTFRRRVPGRMVHAVETDPAKTMFLRVIATQADGAWSAASAGGQDSNVLSAVANATAFAVVPQGTESVDAGTAVALEMFRWPEARTTAEALG